MTSERQGEIYDLGYQRYDGPREGRGRARWALLVNGIRSALGIGRGSRAKVLPALLFVSAVGPAIIMVIIASLAGPGFEVPGHAGYYSIISAILLLFSAIIAPELLIPDRRDRVLDLYLVRPLTPTDYVAGRWSAFLIITLVIVYSGQVLLFLGLLLTAPDPVDYVRENWLDVPRFLAAGFVVAVFTTTLPLAVAAFTSRRAYAASFVIGLWIVSGSAAGILATYEETETRTTTTPDGTVTVRVEVEEGEPISGDMSKWFALLDIEEAPIRINDFIFGEEPESGTRALVRELPDIVPIGWYLILTAGPGFLLWRRYQRIAI